MPKLLSTTSRFIHGSIALYHFVGVILLYQGWPFVGSSSLPLEPIYGESFSVSESTRHFTRVPRRRKSSYSSSHGA